MYDPKDLDKESDSSNERLRKKDRRKEVRDQARALKQTHKDLDPFSYYFGGGVGGQQESPPRLSNRSVAVSPKKGFLGDDMRSSKYGKNEMRSSRYHSKPNDNMKRQKSKGILHDRQVQISPNLNSRSPNRKLDKILSNESNEKSSQMSQGNEKSDYSSEFYSSDEDDKNHPSYFAEIKEHRFHQLPENVQNAIIIGKSKSKHSEFYNRLKDLNEKIGTYKSIFYGRVPAYQLAYMNKITSKNQEKQKNQRLIFESEVRAMKLDRKKLNKFQSSANVITDMQSNLSSRMQTHTHQNNLQINYQHTDVRANGKSPRSLNRQATNQPTQFQGAFLNIPSGHQKSEDFKIMPDRSQSPKNVLGFHTPSQKKQHKHQNKQFFNQHFSHANLNELLKNKKHQQEPSPTVSANLQNREHKKSEDLDIPDSILAAADQDLEMGKHRIAHVRQLRLLDSSRKLIVERPSKFDLMPPSSSGMALNAVDEHEEAGVPAEQKVNEQKVIDSKLGRHEQKVSSLTVKQPSFRSSDVDVDGKHTNEAKSKSRISLSISNPSESLASKSRQINSRLTQQQSTGNQRLTPSKIEIDDLDKKEINFNTSRSSVGVKSKNRLQGIMSSRPTSNKQGAGNVTYHSEQDPSDFDGQIAEKSYEDTPNKPVRRSSGVAEKQVKAQLTVDTKRIQSKMISSKNKYHLATPLQIEEDTNESMNQTKITFVNPAQLAGAINENVNESSYPNSHYQTSEKVKSLTNRLNSKQLKQIFEKVQNQGKLPSNKEMKKVKIKNLHSRYKSTDERSRENSKNSIGSQENLVRKSHRRKHKKRNMKNTANFQMFETSDYIRKQIPLIVKGLNTPSKRDIMKLGALYNSEGFQDPRIFKDFDKQIKMKMSKSKQRKTMRNTISKLEQSNSGIVIHDNIQEDSMRDSTQPVHIDDSGQVVEEQVVSHEGMIKFDSEAQINPNLSSIDGDEQTTNYNNQTVEQINTALLGGISVEQSNAAESQILQEIDQSPVRSPMDGHAQQHRIQTQTNLKEYRSSMDRNTIKSNMKLRKTRIIRNTAQSQYQSITSSTHAHRISKIDKKIMQIEKKMNKKGRNKNSTSNIRKSETIESIRNPLKQLRYAERITSDYSNQKSNLVLPKINASRNSQVLDSNIIKGKKKTHKRDKTANF